MENNRCESCERIRKENDNKIDQCNSCLIELERRFDWFRNTYVRGFDEYDDFT
jgi:hypothetical protein|tara:strand:- start:122 stop:280 length:159 start_codon:yes stop_codon:yes gene_type:complete